MKRKAFWTCTACKAIYTDQGSGFNHIAKAHNGESLLNDPQALAKLQADLQANRKTSKFF